MVQKETIGEETREQEKQELQDKIAECEKRVQWLQGLGAAAYIRNGTAEWYINQKEMTIYKKVCPTRPESSGSLGMPAW